MASTILPSHQTAIVNLYTALFNRAPDASGLRFWAQAYADGASLSTITQSFLATTEGRGVYPASQTATQFVASFYQAVFGRAADAGGLAFWAATLDQAGGPGSDAARGVLVAQIIGVATTALPAKPSGVTDAEYAQTLADRALFANKVAVGDYVVGLSINDVVLTRNVLALVTADPASVATAKAFAANGGVTPPVPDPTPVPTLTITNADAAVDIIAKFAAYGGNIATVDATGMDTTKLAAVAGGIAKIASAGISGVLGLSVADYASAAVATLAAKLAPSATLTVTGTNGADTIDLKAFQRGTSIDAGGGVDTFNAVVDANTPANTTLSAHHTLNGGSGIDDVLDISTTGAVGDALNGADISLIEFVMVRTSTGGSASMVATPTMLDVRASGFGDLTVTNLSSTGLALVGTASTGNYSGTYTGTDGNVSMRGASANVLSLGGNLTNSTMTYSGTVNTVKSLQLGSNVSQMRFQGTDDGIVVEGLSGGAAGGLSLLVTGSGSVTFSGITVSGINVDASTSPAALSLTFDLPAGVVKGGSNADTITVNGAATLTGNGGADVFAIRAGAGQAGTVNQASLMAKMVTITDFSAGDRISVATPVLPSTGPAVALQTFTGTGGTLYAQTLDVASQMQALVTKVPYGAFTYGGASYLLADNGLNGLGAGDVLIQLTGSPDLTRIVYENDVLTMS